MLLPTPTPTHSGTTSPSLPDHRVYPGVSEFGRHIADHVQALPRAKGGVLTDALGDPIDFAYRPSRIASIDIQLFGAQLTQLLHALGQSSARLGMPMQMLMVEAWGGTLLTTQLQDEFLLALLLAPKANLEQAMQHFEALTQALLPLLA